MEGMFVFIVLVATIIIVIYFLHRRTPSKNQTIRNNSIISSMQDEAQQFCNRIFESQEIPEISIPIQLKKGEKGHLSDFAEYHEQRSKTVSTRGGGAIRVAKGVYIGGTQGTARSVPEMRMIDQGNIYFTNKRIVFIGDNAIKEYPLKKIISIDTSANGFWVAMEGKQKRQFYKTSRNPLLWNVLLNIQNQIENGSEIPHINLITEQQ